MGFSLQLAQDLVEVEAGTTSPVTLTVVNKGDATDRYELEVEGVDAEWKAIPVPTFAVETGETHAERLFIRPPRASESLAGNYPFVVRLRSLESGEQRSAQGVIKLKPFYHLTMQIDPKKGSYSPASHRNTFDLTLVNLGNTEHTIHLTGSDPEDDCTYEFEQDQVTLGPGQQRVVSVTVQPVTNPLLSTGKLIGFSIAGRSVDTPSVVATTQGQLEQRSVLSPSTLVYIVLATVIIGLWLYFRPRPPVVSVTVSPMQAVQGAQVTISWNAHDANRVVVSAVSPTGAATPIYDGPDLTNTLPWVPDQAGEEMIVAEAYRDSVHGSTDRKSVAISAPAPVIPPSINSFSVSASSRTVATGADVTFKWNVDNASKVVLLPFNHEYDPAIGSTQEEFKTAGTQECYLLAYASDGKKSVKSNTIRIKVVDVSSAHILQFEAETTTVDPGGTFWLDWNVGSAALIELYPPNGPKQQVTATGHTQFTIPATTTSPKAVFELKATDAQGRSTSQKVVVTIKLAPPPPPPQPTGSTTGIEPSPDNGSTTTGSPPGQTTGGGTGGVGTTTTGRP
jgi:hypothetical protein